MDDKRKRTIGDFFKPSKIAKVESENEIQGVEEHDEGDPERIKSKSVEAFSGDDAPQLPEISESGAHTFPSAESSSESEPVAAKIKPRQVPSIFQKKRPAKSAGLIWSISGSLLKAVGRSSTELSVSDTQPSSDRSSPSSSSVSIAAFDLDSTIVRTKNGNPFPRNGSDWVWLNDSVPSKLIEASKSHCLVIISNQGAVSNGKGKRYEWLKERIETIFLTLAIPLRFYAATRVSEGAPNPYRKPDTGMWDILVKDLAKDNITIEMEKSFYVGDAAGRPDDFSDSDKKFAEALGLDFYTPEEYFN